MNQHTLNLGFLLCLLNYVLPFFNPLHQNKLMWTMNLGSISHQLGDTLLLKCQWVSYLSFYSSGRGDESILIHHTFSLCPVTVSLHLFLYFLNNISTDYLAISYSLSVCLSVCLFLPFSFPSVFLSLSISISIHLSIAPSLLRFFPPFHICFPRSLKVTTI